MRAVVKLRNYLWRPLSGSDADADFVIALRSDDRFGKWFYSRVTRESHRQFVKVAADRPELNWVMERDGTPIGVSSLYNVDWANRKAECGRIVSLDPRAFHLNWLVSAVVGEAIGLNRLYLETLEQNSIIARGVERLGMTREGLLRHHVVREGQPLNVLVYGMTRDQWDTNKQKLFDKFGTPQVISYEGPRVEPLPAPSQLVGAGVG
jgi:RimJ/RimL family protein N-acetyltransferase